MQGETQNGLIKVQSRMGEVMSDMELLYCNVETVFSLIVIAHRYTAVSKTTFIGVSNDTSHAEQASASEI